MPFAYLMPGEHLARTNYLSGIDYAVQITSMHVHVYVDAVPRADRDDVRQIRRGDWSPRASTTTAMATPATRRPGPTRNCPSTYRPPRGGAVAPLVIPSANRTFWG